MKIKKHRTRPRSPKIRKLWDLLLSFGFRRFTLWWEPIAPALEMCGHSGGYMAVIDDSIVPLGICLRDALRGAEVHANYMSLK